MTSYPQFLMKIAQQAPTDWWALHVAAGQFQAQQGTHVARTKTLVLKPIPRGFPDPIKARRDLVRHLRGQVRLHNQAERVQLGAHAFALEGKTADFTVEALPERMAEANKAGTMLRRFVQAGQLLVSAEQIGGDQPQLGDILHRQVAGRLSHMRTQLCPAQGAPQMTMPFRAITVLSIVGEEAPGLSALHRRLIINTLAPKPI